MKNSIIKSKYTFIAFWIIIWHFVSIVIDSKIFLVSPIDVLVRFFELSLQKQFYLIIVASLFRIFCGFFLGFFVGILLAVICKKYKIIYQLFTPIISVIKVIPVASFIILALLWVSSKNLSILISFLMVLPISFSNIYEGLGNVDKKMLEMAKVYKQRKIAVVVYAKALLPFIQSSLVIGLSIAFKSAVSAEVIAITKFSIGGQIQSAKVLLEMSDVFVWTIVIVALSVMFEKLFKSAVGHIYTIIEDKLI